MEKKPPLFVPGISAGNILTIISMAAGGLWMLASMNAAIATQNDKIASTRNDARDAITRVEQQAQRDRTEILETLRDMRQEMRDALGKRR